MDVVSAYPDYSPVYHPPHYNSGSIEVWDAIIAWELPWCLGDAVKYIARAGKKDPEKRMEDLEKAINYIKKEMQRLQYLDDQRHDPSLADSRDAE